LSWKLRRIIKIGRPCYKSEDLNRKYVIMELRVVYVNRNLGVIDDPEVYVWYNLVIKTFVKFEPITKTIYKR